MGLFDFFRRKNTYTPHQEITQSTQVLSTGVSYIDTIAKLFKGHVSGAKAMYNTLPEVYAPVEFIIEKALDIPKVHQRKKGDIWIDIENSPIDKKLNKPNQYDNRRSFEKQILLNLILFGESIVNKVTPAGFRIIDGQLYVFPSDQTTVQYSMDFDFRAKYLQKITYSGITLTEPEQYEYYRDTNSVDTPDERAVSKLARLLLSGNVLQAVSESNFKIVNDRGALGIIYPTGDVPILTDKSQEKILAKFHEKYGTTAGKSPIAILGGQVGYQQIGMNIRDLMLNESQLREFRQICRVLQLPALLLGDMEKSTYNNFATAEMIGYRNAIMPYVAKLVDIETKIFDLPDDERIFADYSEISALQPDRKISMEIISRMFRDGVIDANEYRTADSFDEKPELENRYYEQNQARSNQENSQGEDPEVE